MVGKTPEGVVASLEYSARLTSHSRADLHLRRGRGMASEHASLINPTTLDRSQMRALDL